MAVRKSIKRALGGGLLKGLKKAVSSRLGEGLDPEDFPRFVEAVKRAAHHAGADDVEVVTEEWTGLGGYDHFDVMVESPRWGLKIIIIAGQNPRQPRMALMIAPKDAMGNLPDRPVRLDDTSDHFHDPESDAVREYGASLGELEDPLDRLGLVAYAGIMPLEESAVTSWMASSDWGAPRVFAKKGDYRQNPRRVPRRPRGR